MKIVGEVPVSIMPRSQRVVSVRYTAKWGPVWAKWPRGRKDPLPAITQQQVATWDWVIDRLFYTEPSEVAIAETLSKGTAFYARDMRIMAMYGHYISWHGWGPWPFGVQYGVIVHYDTISTAI